jgi:hypothetical protein
MPLPSAAYLVSGATSFVASASNWTDSTGFQAQAQLFIQSGTQTITGGLTTSLVTGITNLDILPGFSGNIGGAAGSLAVETDTASYAPASQVPRIRYNASGGTLYYTPQSSGAAADVADYFQVNGSGSAFLTGTGTVKRVEVQSGRLYVAPTIGSVATYRWVLAGGTTTIDGTSTGSTKIHAITVVGGQHLLKKGIQGSTLGSTTFVEGLNVCGGSLVIDAYGETISDLRIYGGYVTVVNCGTIAVCSGYSGTLDFSKLQRPLTITLLEDAPGLTVIPSKLLTITTYSGATNGRQPIGTGANGLT